MDKFRNTLQKGSVRCLIFKEADIWYGAALEFNIVESGDSHQEVMLLLQEAILGYLETAKKMKLRPDVLNQKPDSEYEKMYLDFQAGKYEKTRKVVSASEFSIGRLLNSSLVFA